VNRRLVLSVLVALAVPALALAAGTDPQKQINSVDQRKAASIVFKKADFPVAGWTKVPSNGSGDLSCPGYNPDESDLILTGEAEASFRSGTGIPSFNSAASVYKTKRDALASWTRGVKPALASCMARTLQEAFRQSGAKVAILSKGQIALPKLAPRTAAYRLVFNVSYTEAGKTTSVSFVTYLIALGSGRGEADLMVAATGKTIPSADLRAFANLIARRLAAAKL
jgi:hypothetical protein